MYNNIISLRRTDRMVLGLAELTSNWRDETGCGFIEVVYRTCSGLATTVLGEQLVGRGNMAQIEVLHI
jgi:hypothetical protein